MERKGDSFLIDGATKWIRFQVVGAQGQRRETNRRWSPCSLQGQSTDQRYQPRGLGRNSAKESADRRSGVRYLLLRYAWRKGFDHSSRRFLANTNQLRNSRSGELVMSSSVFPRCLMSSQGVPQMCCWM